MPGDIRIDPIRHGGVFGFKLLAVVEIWLWGH
jgi:hypothetical protein